MERPNKGTYKKDSKERVGIDTRGALVTGYRKVEEEFVIR
jgi:hypothetical protein